MPHTQIVFLVLPQIHLLDLAGPDQVFHEALLYGADLSIEYCSIGENIETSSKFPLGRLKNFREVALTYNGMLTIRITPQVFC